MADAQKIKTDLMARWEGIEYNVAQDAYDDLDSFISFAEGIALGLENVDTTDMDEADYEAQDELDSAIQGVIMTATDLHTAMIDYVEEDDDEGGEEEMGRIMPNLKEHIEYIEV